MPQRTKNRNEYVKEGGFQRAVKDFKKYKPQNIRYIQESDSVKVVFYFIYYYYFYYYYYYYYY